MPRPWRRWSDPTATGPAGPFRLGAEEIPIWPLIGLIHHLAGATDPDAITPEIIAAVAMDYGISETAVAAAMHYYLNNRCPIDTLLEENAAWTA